MKISFSHLQGLYVGIVLSIGRFLRLWVSDLVKRIYIDDMESVDTLMTMCEVSLLCFAVFKVADK